MKKGFTLIEMLVVFVILGILSTVGVYSYQAALRKGEVDAFISELQSQLTPVVYGQGSESGTQYNSINDFAIKSTTAFGPGSNVSSGGVKGIAITFVGNTLNTTTNATDSNLKSIKIYNKIGNFSVSEKNTFYLFGGTLSDSISKTIAIPSGVFFDSACLVSDSHANCDTSTPVIGNGQTTDFYIAYHGSNSSPYVFNNSSHKPGFGLRLNFRSQLEPLWYTITFSPYGGMTVGRGCKIKECI